MAGLSFDDLIPEGGARSIFDDLIPPPKKKDTGTQHVDGSTVYVDEMLFGLPGKAAAGMNALIRAPFTDKTIGEEYDTIRGQYQNARQKYADENPVSNAAASIAGSIHGGVALGRAAGPVLNAGGRALTTALPSAAPAINTALNAGNAVATRLGGNYAGRMVLDAASGAGQGALSAYGHDQDVGTGAAIGGAVGGLARPVMSAGGAVLRSLGGLVGVGNESRAQNAIAQAIMRSGRSADDVANDLATAAQQGQPEYMVADALGNSGQRMLTGIARSPGDMRQTIAETIQSRQMDQGGRVASALQDASGSPLTASQYQELIAAQRAEDAARNYAPVTTDRTAIDLSSPVGLANRAISPAADTVATSAGAVTTDLAARSGIEAGEASIRDPIRQAVKEARSYLASDTNTVTNVEKAFRAKTNIDQMISAATEKGQGGTVEALKPIRDALDEALANTSQPYASARDAYRTASGHVDAVDTGRALSSPRGRTDDKIATFGALPDDQSQQAARIGYFDPLISKAESQAGTMSNAARPFTSNSARRELPVMAAPGKDEVLMDRLAREQRMFETGSAALGGSRTADNAADMADIQGFDPSMISAFATGGIKGAALHGLQQGVNALNGRNTATRDMIARMLLQSDPTRARAELAQAVASGQRLTRAQESIIRGIIGASSTAAPKLLGN